MGTEQRCKNCRHFGDEEDKQNSKPEEPRDCVKISEAESPTLAYTVDGSGYYSALMVYPEFGCVLFETEEG